MPPRRFLVPAGVHTSLPITAQAHLMSGPALARAVPQENEPTVIHGVLPAARTADLVRIRVPPNAVLDTIHVREVVRHDRHTRPLSQGT